MVSFIDQNKNLVINRDKMNYLVDWANRKEFKPLMVLGSRQVGKTFLIKEIFAEQYFPNRHIYINFMNNKELKDDLDGIKDASTIIGIIETKFKVQLTNEWLIIFDEIQEIPSLRTALKSFNEDFKNYYKVIVTGSYLGNTIMTDGEGFPVGQIEKININPISFKEYLKTVNLSHFVDRLQNIIDSKLDYELIPNKLNESLVNSLKEFLMVGGMPEVLKIFINNNKINDQLLIDTRKRIYESYVTDITKYINTSNIDKTKSINLYTYLPVAFKKQNNRFVLNVIQKDARINDYNDALFLLTSSNLVFKISKLEEVKQNMILPGNLNAKMFKLYFNDHGFINMYYELDNNKFWDVDGEIANIRGSLLENYVASELANQVDVNKFLKYFTFKINSNSYEIDFILEDTNYNLIPIEVKASMKFNLSSLKKYIDVYKPKYAIVLSFKNFAINEYNGIKIYYIPVYCVSLLNIRNNRLIALVE